MVRQRHKERSKDLSLLRSWYSLSRSVVALTRARSVLHGNRSSTHSSTQDCLHQSEPICCLYRTYSVACTAISHAGLDAQLHFKRFKVKVHNANNLVGVGVGRSCIYDLHATLRSRNGARRLSAGYGSRSIKRETLWCVGRVA